MTEKSPVATSQQSSIVEIDLEDLTCESFQTSKKSRDGCLIGDHQGLREDVETATTHPPFHVLVSPPSLYKLAYTDEEKNDTTRRRMLNEYIQQCFIECDNELEWDNYFTTYTDDNDFDADTISSGTKLRRRKNSALRRKGYHPSIVCPMYLALPPPELIYQKLLKMGRKSLVLQNSSSGSDTWSETFGQQPPSVGSTSSAIGHTSSRIGQPVRDDFVTNQKCYERQRSQDIQKQKILSQENVNTENDDDARQDDETPSQQTFRGRHNGAGFSLQDVTVETSTDLKGRLVYKLTCYTVRATKKIVHLLWWLG